MKSKKKKRAAFEGEASSGEADLAAVFKALSNPTRLRVFETIRRGAADGDKSCSGSSRPPDAPPRSICVCEIIDAVPDVSPPTISHHLKELRNAGLADAVRVGKWHYYSARLETTETVYEYFSGRPRIPAAERKTER